jgi:hypothetical protein
MSTSIVRTLREKYPASVYARVRVLALILA